MDNCSGRLRGAQCHIYVILVNLLNYYCKMQGLRMCWSLRFPTQRSSNTVQTRHYSSSGARYTGIQEKNVKNKINKIAFSSLHSPIQLGEFAVCRSRWHLFLCSFLMNRECSPTSTDTTKWLQQSVDVDKLNAIFLFFIEKKETDLSESAKISEKI